MSSPLINSLFAYGITGPTTSADGSPARERFSRDGAQVVQDGHARYTETTLRGNVYSVMNSAAQALSLTGTTTYTGLVVYNKVGSTKNLAIINVSYLQTTIATGVGGVALFYQAPAGSLPALTATNAANGALSGYLNSATSPSASVASSCTLAANPIVIKPMISIPWITAVSQGTYAYSDDLAGQFIVPPGGGVGIVAITTALTGYGFISWEEVAL
jgi:hypothetical protein